MSDKKRSIHLPGDENKPDDFLEGQSWFFGIGINKYDEFPDLVNAVKDVQDVKTLLIEQYALPADNVYLLFDEAANEENIIDRLDKLAERVKPDDNLIIYYSGHGHLNQKTGIGFWIPSDAKKDKTSRYIRNSTIRDYIKVIKVRHTLLISDSCFSGSLFAHGGNRSTRALEELEKIPSRWAICSGRHDEEVYDGEPGKNSPFAESILDTLRYNEHAILNVAKLADRVIEQTSANYEQLPEGNPLYGVGHKGGQYVFKKVGATIKTPAKKVAKRKPKPATQPATTTATNWKKYLKFAPLLLLIPLLIWFLSPSDDYYEYDEEGNTNDMSMVDDYPDIQEPDDNVDLIDAGAVSLLTTVIDGKIWLKENMSIPDDNGNSWAQANDYFGLFYTWEAAKSACEKLGPGWRLPTDEEWKMRCMKNGGYTDNTGMEQIKYGEPAAAMSKLIQQAFPVGGGILYNPSTFTPGTEPDTHGLMGTYWSGTAADERSAYSWSLLNRPMDIQRSETYKTAAAFCRCVKD